MNSSIECRQVRLLAVLTVAAVLSACGAMRKTPPPVETAKALQPLELPDKGDPQARFDAALALMQRNQPAEAEQAFVTLITDFPEHAGPWVNLGILYARSNRRDQAIAALAKAASMNPANKVAYNWLGILYREAGDPRRARMAYEKALGIDPEYALAHYNLGVLLDAHLKQPADALPHYRAYLQALGKEDLRVMAWIAGIEHAAPPAPGSAPMPERTP